MKILEGRKTVGKTLIKGTSNFAEDAINGKNIKASAKRHFEESLDELSDKAGIMKGDGYSKNINKRKTKEENRVRKKRKNNKRTIDIFDKK
jgi:hypothetical protein